MPGLLDGLTPQERYRASQRAMAAQFDRPTTEESPLIQRGGLLPIGIYENGRAGPAWPGIVVEPLNAMARLLHNGYTPGTYDTRGVEDAFNVGGAMMTGGLLGPRPSNSLGIGGYITKNKNNTYPGGGLNPLHPVQDWNYVRQLIRAARKGADINPILYEGLPNNGNLLAGTHRQMANDIMKSLGDRNRIPRVELNDVLSDPGSYGLDKRQARDLRRAVEDNDYEAVDAIWDRR